MPGYAALQPASIRALGIRVLFAYCGQSERERAEGREVTEGNPGFPLFVYGSPHRCTACAEGATGWLMGLEPTTTGITIRQADVA